LPAILAITWCAAAGGKFNLFFAVLCLIGVVLVHIGANTINDYFDWNVSDASNPNAGPFNGGSRNAVGDRVPRGRFLMIALASLLLLIFIALIFILEGRFYVLYFSLSGLAIGYLYSSPPFRLHSRGFGEFLIFLAFGPVLSAAVCYVIAGTVTSVNFLIGIPAGLSTTAVLWINQFPDYAADKTSGKANLTVRLGLRNSIPVYVLLIFSVYLSVAILILYHIFSPWSALIVILIPGSIKSIEALFKNYENPKALMPVQGFTISFQMLSILLTAAGLVIGRFTEHWRF
jgi:1,4-dihydroxy-2-naphthoate octaprenyltransferase